MLHHHHAYRHPLPSPSTLPGKRFDCTTGHSDHTVMLYIQTKDHRRKNTQQLSDLGNTDVLYFPKCIAVHCSVLGCNMLVFLTLMQFVSYPHIYSHISLMSNYPPGIKVFIKWVDCKLCTIKELFLMVRGNKSEVVTKKLFENSTHRKVVLVKQHSLTVTLD